MLKVDYGRWLEEPPLSGWLALIGGAVAVAAPTLIRHAVSGSVTGCEFTPYLPFVLLSAILLRWWQAAAVALVSVAIMGGLFVAPASGFAVSSCFLSAAGMFLAGATAMIGTVMLMRRTVAAMQRRRGDHRAGDIVFSLENEQVWASWYRSGPPVHLGPQAQVEPMMEDFLAQVELGKRLTRKSDRGAG